MQGISGPPLDGHPGFLHVPISCSVVLMPYHGSTLQSHTFLGLPVSSILLTQRDGVQSIMLGTILALTRQAIVNGEGVPFGLSNILAGSNLDIVVATSRVPAFDEDIQNPINGYRSLGLLSCVTVQNTLPSPFFDHRQELFAVHSVEDPKTDRFNKMWRTCGLDITRHFIIIFVNISRRQPRHPSPFLNSTFSNPTSLVSSRRSSVGFDCTPSPLASDGTGGICLFGLRDSSPATRASPASNSPAATSEHIDDFDHSLVPTQQSAHQSYRDMLEAICTQRGLSAATLHDAKCKLNTKRLLPMVLNHKRMTEVLVALGIQDQHHTVAKVVVINGVEHTTGSVVKEFEWSLESYRHKSQWFGWAAHASRSMQWVGRIPADGNEECNLYKTWLGIEYFWSPEGPVETGCYPSSDHPDFASEAVQSALVLTQSSITHNKAAIALHLKSVTDQ